MSKCASISFLLLFTLSIYAQKDAIIDEPQIRRLPNDSTKVIALNRLASQLIYSDPVKAYTLLDQSVALAERLRFDNGLAMAFGAKATLLFYKMELDSAEIWIDRAFDIVGKKRDSSSRSQTAQLLGRYAAIFQQRQKYDSAVSKYLESVQIFTEIGDGNKAILAFYNLSGIYNFLGEYEKAIYYARETRRIALQSSEKEYLVRAYMSLAEAFINLKEYDSLFTNAERGLALATESKMSFAIAKFNEQLGIYFARNSKQYDSAIAHLEIALKTFNQIDTRYDIAIVLQNLGNVYLNLKDYGGAVDYATQGLELARELKLDQVMHLCLKDLVEAYEKIGNITESHRYLKEFVVVNDSLLVRNNRKVVGELEAKFQNQKKEVQLAVQEKIIREKNLLNYILAGAAITSVIIIFLLFRTYRQRQKLQQQRMNELETEKQLLATEAVLKGEEKERTRLAKDLHDGLGGMLSGIKYSFQNLKGNMVMTADNQVAFEKGILMLDSSIKEMRRVAHNMMPEALVKFGLDTALNDFCKDINQSKAINLSYQSIGLENKSLDQTLAITIYRVIQELVNNIIKHAEAKNGIVQLALIDQNITITVEDDGKGFDTVTLQKAKGIGWSNIESRVEFLKGILDIQSEAGKGTSIHIELKA